MIKSVSSRSIQLQLQRDLTIYNPHIDHDEYMSARHIVHVLISFSWSTDFLKLTSSFFNL